MSDPWWTDAVVYQVYPRSFADANGDGVGDLRGIASRLDHVAGLGADALWLSPIYPSPMADGGYDVSDFCAVDPRFGSLDDLDALAEGCQERGMKLLLDLVPCHTSIEHPWFRERPEFYVWSDRDGPGTNWRAAFGGPAWTRDEVTGRWYLHSFYAEQPDLDWRNPDVRAAMGEVLRFWLGRGVDGFRLDAIDRLLKDPQLRDDPPATAPPTLPGHPEHVALEHLHSRAAPDIGLALAALRAAAGDAFLVGEVYLESDRLGPYLEHVDAAFAFELLHAPWQADAIRAVLRAARGLRLAWVLSNHDFPRLPDRVGAGNARAAALLALALPGPAFVYQGDELGTPNGAHGEPPDDRYGRDPFRGPMCWDASAPHGGFGTAEPWLPVTVPPEGGVAQQDGARGSTLAFYRELIAARRELGGGFELLPGGADGVVSFTRESGHVVAVNLAGEERTAPAAGRLLVATDGGTGRAPGRLAAGTGFVADMPG